jgi:outer membrane protein TolC
MGNRNTGFLASLFLVLCTGCGSFDQTDTTQTRLTNSQHDLLKARQAAPAPAETVALQDAVDYALKHNLQLWMARQEQAIALERQSSATLKMLPSLRANGEHSRRNKHSASTSVNLFTGVESLSTSYSSEKEKDTFDLSATWNLLDFGVTYLRAKQEAGRVIIAEQDLRRTRQRVAMDVTNAYWQAITAKRLAEEADGVLKHISLQIAAVRGQLKKGNISESAAIEAELPLLRQRHRMRAYQRDYATAMQNLAKLMGVPVGARFDVADPGDLSIPGTDLVEDLEQLEKTALLNRPELFQNDMRHRISQHDARIALIEMFPAPSVFWRYNHDGNKYLYHNDWQTVGLSAAWDVLSIPRKIAGRRARIKETELAEKRRLATTIAILTQVHIAAIEYQSALSQMQDVKLIEQKSQRMVEMSKKEARDGTGHAGETLSMKVQRIQDMDAFLRGYAQLMAARARLYSSLGVDPAEDGTVALPDPRAPGDGAGAEGGPEGADVQAAEASRSFLLGSWHFGEGPSEYTHTYAADGTFTSTEDHPEYQSGTWRYEAPNLHIRFDSGKEFCGKRVDNDTFDWGDVHGRSSRIEQVASAADAAD